VIFKDPLGAFAPFGPLVYPTPSPQALVREQQISAAQQKSSSSQSLQIIAPKPPQLGYLPGAVPQFNNVVYPGQAAQAPSDPLNLDQNYYPTPTASKFTFFPPETVDAFSQNQWRQDPQRLEPQLDFNQFPSPPQEDILGDVSPRTLHEPQLPLNEDPVKIGVDPHQFLDLQYTEGEYPVYEEDASMGESEDDEPFLGRRESKLELNDLGLIVSQKLNDRYESFGMQPRTFAFHADHILAIYEPSPGNSPLNNKQLASVFWHFVNVTGPTISLYERHPFDRVAYYQGQNIKNKQHIWTCEYTSHDDTFFFVA
jgi:hypothetical protein